MSNKNSGVISNRASLRFNPNDEDHMRVIVLLKSLGRKQSQFIVKAVIYYIENSPEFAQARENNKQKESLEDRAVNVILGKGPALVVPNQDLVPPKTKPATGKKRGRPRKQKAENIPTQAQPVYQQPAPPVQTQVNSTPNVIETKTLDGDISDRMSDGINAIFSLMDEEDDYGDE